MLNSDHARGGPPGRAGMLGASALMTAHALSAEHVNLLLAGNHPRPMKLRTSVGKVRSETKMLSSHSGSVGLGLCR